MPARVIGLDIGTFAVRAAEVVLANDGPRVVRFGQLTLPPGAVVSGEVIDAAAVAATLRRLWERVGFRSRQVVLGIANQRVLVRQVEMPSLSDQDLTAALQFEDSDVLPFAPGEATLDYQRLEETVNDAGEARVRLLLASAQRSMLANHLLAAELAGLRVIRVDPMPLALVRSIGRSGLAALDDGAACEALICVGAGITTIVIHEGGVPRFARFLTEGAGSATEAISAELGTDLDAAEDLKRRVGSDPVTDNRPGLIVEGLVDRLAGEIDSSIRFYASQNPEPAVGRIILTGAGSRLFGLPEQLGALSGLPVEPARPAGLYRIEAGLSDDELGRAEPNLATVIGLALATVPPGPGQRRINLLPEVLETVREERAQTVAAGVIVAVVAIALLAAWALRAGQAGDQRRQADASRAQAALLNRQIAALGNASNPQGELARDTQQIRSALTGDTDWAGLLTQVANVIPQDVWLTSMTGAASTGAAPGTVTFQGMGFDQTSTARWLSDVGQLDSLSGLWVSSSSRGTRTGLVTFSSQGSLGPGAAADRLSRYTGGQP